MMNNDHNILTGTNAANIRQLLETASSQPALDAWISLYESIWKMTYANATNMNELQDMDLAERIALMNEQEDFVPLPLCSPEEVTALDLGGFPEAVFFPELDRYQKLKTLDLWENGLSSVPKELFGLRSLEALRIADPVTTFPEEFINLTQLKKLCIEGHITQIPESFKELKHLQILDLTHNRLSAIPAFLAELPELKSIYVKYNPDLVVSDDLISMFKEKGILLEY